jgi:hypothetical protein
MIFNNSDFHTSLLMIELQEGVPFHESPISLNFGMTSLDSPALANPEVNAFLQTFTKFGVRAGFEVDTPEEVLSEKPGVFITVGNGITQQDALDAINAHLPEPYVPHLADFHSIGFFPSRPGSPVRELSKDGKGYQNGEVVVQEGVTNPPDWALAMVEEAKKHCKCFYNHYKTSIDGTNRKVYVLTEEIY